MGEKSMHIQRVSMYGVVWANESVDTRHGNIP